MTSSSAAAPEKVCAERAVAASAAHQKSFIESMIAGSLGQWGGGGIGVELTAGGPIPVGFVTAIGPSKPYGVFEDPRSNLSARSQHVGRDVPRVSGSYSVCAVAAEGMYSSGSCNNFATIRHSQERRVGKECR